MFILITGCNMDPSRRMTHIAKVNEISDFQKLQTKSIIVGLMLL